jgi:hypothetical protein
MLRKELQNGLQQFNDIATGAKQSLIETKVQDYLR